MRSRRASHGSARPLNCGVRRPWGYRVDCRSPDIRPRGDRHGSMAREARICTRSVAGRQRSQSVRSRRSSSNELLVPTNGDFTTRPILRRSLIANATASRTGWLDGRIRKARQSCDRAAGCTFANGADRLVQLSSGWRSNEMPRVDRVCRCDCEMGWSQSLVAIDYGRLLGLIGSISDD